jgi:hypothetical protein
MEGIGEFPLLEICFEDLLRLLKSEICPSRRFAALPYFDGYRMLSGLGSAEHVYQFTAKFN